MEELVVSRFRLTAEEMIAALGLVPLPGEGGFYRETYRSHDGTTSGRSIGTCIYFLITPTSYSLLHRLKCDEMYHFYAGDPVELVQVGLDGKIVTQVLGDPTVAGQLCQWLVPAGNWQGSRLVAGGAWGLMGTTVWPGFDLSDFELALPGDERFRAEQLQPFLPV